VIVDPLAVALTIALASPAVVVALIGSAAVLRVRISERVVGWATQLAMVACTSSILFATATLLGSGAPTRRVPALFWLTDAAELELLLDGTSLSFACVTAVICAVVARFSHSYLHAEPGFLRYFLLFNAFVLGMLLIAVAGSVTLLFSGWEILGVSSALLVAFFHERSAPLHNALYVFSVYRLGDAAMLSAAILVHHALGSGRLETLFASGTQAATLSAPTANAVAVLLVVAAAAKCGQLPFSGWMPRAMEGPTPSSAVFYGALSVHAGALVLLRAAPILEQAPLARVLVVLMGVATALFATTVGRVQTDIKSALAFASLTQVSLILVEIGLGLYRFALLHMAGHAFVRLLQFLRAPSILHDVHEAESAVGGHLGRTGRHLELVMPLRLQRWLYRFALERGYLDASLDRFAVAPVLALASRLDRLERAWCDWLAQSDAKSGPENVTSPPPSLPVYRDE
jgi:NAD(P)H-quinone oxidoreductase subunit 5